MGSKMFETKSSTPLGASVQKVCRMVVVVGIVLKVAIIAKGNLPAVNWNREWNPPSPSEKQKQKGRSGEGG